ncbi:hypothetical protein [Alteribacter keqinensis]|uniref:Uncharacterized protein n=1 Tax=Alteribacter keqinensis TaxID=2483800 RepID=A0A3M7TRA7_9BACI|nr:hypothetical protein [Alteribacter keqinensis]RNA67560.1 hypothetical protein EBO34_12595 [Alteribacter keqinensis]
MSSDKCSKCFDGYILDTNYLKYKRVDEQIDKLFDGGQFSYYDAFKYVTSRNSAAKKKCVVCNGTGKMH